MDATQTGIAIIAAAGGGGTIVALINFFSKLITGKAGRERAKNTSLISQRMDAIEERDAADDARRLEQERSARYRRLLIENGINPDEPPIADTKEK